MENKDKAVLISTQPKWCELILKGEKTIEVRKTKPKLELPFKCYIYQSKGRDRLIEVMKDGDENYGEIYHGKPVFIKTRENSGYKGLFGRKQKIVGEFVCDTIVTDKTFGHDPLFNGAACMSEAEAAAYSCQSPIYGWHISNLIIYENPKELSKFKTLCKYRNDDGSCRYNKIKCQYAVFDYNQDGSVNLSYCSCCMKRPPQSWCYVEELENDRT